MSRHPQRNLVDLGAFPDAAPATNRAFADLSVSRRAEIAVINPETCFDRPTGEATKREISQAA